MCEYVFKHHGHHKHVCRYVYTRTYMFEHIHLYTVYSINNYTLRTEIMDETHHIHIKKYVHVYEVLS